MYRKREVSRPKSNFALLSCGLIHMRKWPSEASPVVCLLKIHSTRFIMFELEDVKRLTVIMGYWKYLWKSQSVQSKLSQSHVTRVLSGEILFQSTVPNQKLWFWVFNASSNVIMSQLCVRWTSAEEEMKPSMKKKKDIFICRVFTKSQISAWLWLKPKKRKKKVLSL